MSSVDVAIEVVSLPLPVGWWREFQEQWIASQIEPWQTRLRVLLTAPATLHWNSVCFIAMRPESGAIMSAAILDNPRRRTPSGFRSCWLAHVFTVPEARGQGLATRIVKKAVDHVSHADVEEIVLATSKAHSRSSPYAKVGFHPVAESGCLMRFEVLESQRSGVSTPASASKAPFRVRVDDLGACASIGARSHCAVRGDVICEEGGLDIEELLCTLLSQGPQLGSVRFFGMPEGATVGIWDMPATSATPSTLLATSTPDLRSLVEKAPSLRIPQALGEEFTYLTAHESVA